MDNKIKNLKIKAASFWIVSAIVFCVDFILNKKIALSFLLYFVLGIIGTLLYKSLKKANLNAFKISTLVITILMWLIALWTIASLIFVLFVFFTWKH